MPSTFDPLLRLELQADGENSTTWGQRTNKNIELLADSIAGRAVINVTGTGDYTLSTANASVEEARMSQLEFAGIPSAPRNIIIPSSPKTYVVQTSSNVSHPLTIKTAVGTGFTINTGERHFIACDGVSVVPVVIPTSVDLSPFVLKTGDDMTGPLRGQTTATAAAPAFSFEGDTNTGLWRPAEDQLALSLGGTNRLTLTTTGATLTTPLAMSSQKITGLAAGTASGDAVNRSQLDSIAATGSAGPFSLTGSAVDVTGIPAGVRQLWVVLDSVDLASVTAPILLQLGTASGIETSAYFSHGHASATSGAGTSSSNGYPLHRQSNLRGVFAAAWSLFLVPTNRWIGTLSGFASDGGTFGLIGGGGTKTLASTLAQVRIGAVGSTFSTGSVTVHWRQ